MFSVPNSYIFVALFFPLNISTLIIQVSILTPSLFPALFSSQIILNKFYHIYQYPLGAPGSLGRYSNKTEYEVS